MPVDLQEVSDNDARAIVAQINSQGFGVVPNYIKPDMLADMRQFVDRAMKKSNGEYVSFNGPKAVAGCVLKELGESPAFQRLMQNLYAFGTGAPAPAADFYFVLRCLSGKSAARHCMKFHYDSYVVTALIPIEIPTQGKTGDLIMIPNTRGIRSSYLINLLDKALLDNNLTQAALGHFARSDLLKFTRISPVPGSIYFFWGYRSIHTNEGCDEDKVRATALFHYVNPHADSALNRRLKSSLALLSRRPIEAPGT